MGFPGWAIFLIVFFVLLPLAIFAIYTLYARHHASQRGAPVPPLNPFSDAHRIPANDAHRGLRMFFDSTVDKVRTAVGRSGRGGAYQSTRTASGMGGDGDGPRSGGRRTGTFGPLDPDEAWDTRVGNEADDYGPGGYYEEQELGLHSNQAYAGVPGGLSYEAERGRSRDRHRELDQRYDEEMGRTPANSGAAGKGKASNPFADSTAERSDMGLRSVSPRPHVGADEADEQRKKDSMERRSMFKEQM